MKEAEWLACRVPHKAVDHVRRDLERRVPDRKLWLFACACCRRVWDFMEDARSRDVVLMAERLADGSGSREGLSRAARVAEQVAEKINRSLGATSPQAAAARTAGSFMQKPYVAAVHVAHHALYAEEYVQKPADEEEAEERRMAASLDRIGAVQCDLLRDIIGNPFRPVAPDELWRTATVTSLALTVYDQRQLPQGHLDPARLAVLSDALEEAGCADTVMLNHLRSRGPHVRGCWVVDLILGRS